ncbi:unnamed protein product [Ceutorhynchus assimilis]|uniref:Cyclic GMP-AMP synthase n=1 Tax=Ceutorhynchus assimilis TaxID=467358 RepID=A0A9N9MXE3_9CUCU|nr:unnamed protein product [Ceutorhynchus assimilis]
MSYKNMENVLQKINQKYISLNNDEVKHNNARLKSTLESMICEMKKQSAVFKTVFDKPFYGGSFYDDLKVGSPDEFDLDLLLVLPKSCEKHKKKNCGCVKLETSNKPGFFWYKIDPDYYPPFKDYIENDYLQTNLILDWVKGLVTKALNSLNSVDFSWGTPRYHSESGPALTLKLYGQFGHFDVDLVPAFKFGPESWPQYGYKPNSSRRKTDFFIVPKKARLQNCGERYWRASFQDQERELIEGKQRLKPALRLLKKMRNNLGQVSVSSYALKTLVLWDLDSGYLDFNAPLADVFMKLLKKYAEHLQAKCVPYYWNKNNNLLDTIQLTTLENHQNEISRKIANIERNYLADPLVVVKIILKEGTQEYNLFMTEYFPINAVPSLGLGNLSLSDRHRPAENQGGIQQVANANYRWGIAGAILGIGTVAAVSIYSAITRNRNNQN